jgi:peptidoglycan/LPS O-acetylase OafA/YrhL
VAVSHTRIQMVCPFWLTVILVFMIPYGASWDLMRAAVLPFFVGACVIREDNGLAPLLRLRPLAHIGVVSYGMYMLNTLTLDGLHPVLTRIGLQHPFLTFPIFLTMTVLVASVSYRYFESPFLALKSRFAQLGTESGATAGKVRACQEIAVPPQA